MKLSKLFVELKGSGSVKVDVEGPRVAVDLVFASSTTSSPTASSAITVRVDSPDGRVSSCTKMNGRAGVERKRMYKFAL